MAYLRPNELPIEDLITTVTELKQRFPNRVIDAYQEYMSVSRIIRLPNVLGNSDMDQRAIDAIGTLAEEGHFKLLKKRFSAITEELGRFKSPEHG